MLAEFKYAADPKESFSWFMGSQDKPRFLFYLLKKCAFRSHTAWLGTDQWLHCRDFFPWVYWNGFVKGTWFGASGPFRPAMRG